MKESKKVLIDDIPFFSHLNEEEKNLLLAHASFEIYPTGEVIIRKGEFAVDYYLLLEGTVEALFTHQGKIQSLSTLQKGEGFGETALIGKAHRETSYRSSSPITVLRIDIPSLKNKKMSIIHKLTKHLANCQHETIKTLKKDFATKLMEAGKVLTYQNPSTHTFYNKGNTLTPEELDQLIQNKQLKLPSNPSQSTLITARAGVASGEQAGAIKEALQKGAKEIERSQALSEKQQKEESKKREDISLENYDNIIRKLYLAYNQIHSVLTPVMINTLLKESCHYLKNTCQWPQNIFVQGTQQLKQALHMVVLCPYGDLAYRSAFPYLPFSHRVVGYPQRSVVGTFLGSNSKIEAYFNNLTPDLSLRLDRLMPLDKPKTAVEKQQEIGRLKDNQESWQQLEVLTHSGKDVNPNTLFVVFDNEMGSYTQFVKRRFKRQACITVIKGLEYEPNNLDSLFSLPQKKLALKGLFHNKLLEDNKGFEKGSCHFISDLSPLYAHKGNLKDYGFVFGTLALLGHLAPEESEVSWGSAGGSSGVLKAVRILYGNKGPQNLKDIEAAVKWADSLKSKS